MRRRRRGPTATSPSSPLSLTDSVIGSSDGGSSAVSRLAQRLRQRRHLGRLEALVVEPVPHLVDAVARLAPEEVGDLCPRDVVASGTMGRLRGYGRVVTACRAGVRRPQCRLPRAPPPRRERGRGRASVFGVSDGLVSNVSLILGVAGAGTTASVVRTRHRRSDRRRVLDGRRRVRVDEGATRAARARARRSSSESSTATPRWRPSSSRRSTWPGVRSRHGARCRDRDDA